MSKEAKLVSSVGSLALVSKNKNVIEEEEEDDMLECDITSDEYAMMVSNPKKFARKKFPKEDEKKEIKLVGDSGYDCNYCHDKNHFAKDCMLKKLAERRESEDDEAYHMRKLEDIKKKKNSAGPMNALIIQEKVIDDEFGGVEVWSTDSEDEKVRRPTHDSAFVTRQEDEKVTGRCLMVTDGVTTESEHEEPNLHEEKCFAAKPISEKINDYDRLIKKEDEVIAECESIMSSEETSIPYKIGLEKIETFIDSKEHKCMLKLLLDENDKLKIKTETLKSFESSNAKLMTEHKINIGSTSEFDDKSETSEISVEDVINCSEFLKSETETEKLLISEKSVEYAVKEKAVVYQKSAPIDNADETVALSEQTSWRVKCQPPVQPKVVIKPEPKGNEASGSSVKEKKGSSNDDSDEDQETITDILKRKQRDRELNETQRIAKEEEEKERKRKEEHDALECKMALFLPWTREKMINEIINEI
ncbi:uncharacterized protein LOC128127298 [Lactuca sativa]|uniref:uncharacterized protein LOC128127298 n=1 Tax=Lactuca sativa TaxID=4236 RepID=UPI0022AE9BEC|nr:uncharacterized protein LOC128127298 [Lactuca sativa]